MELPANSLTLFIFAVVFVVIAVGTARGPHPKKALEAWAKDRSYTVVEREARYFRRGPFTSFWETSNFVYLVTVRDTTGERRRAWVLLSPKLFQGYHVADVKWEAETGGSNGSTNS